MQLPARFLGLFMVRTTRKRMTLRKNPNRILQPRIYISDLVCYLHGLSEKIIQVKLGIRCRP